ncbi:hypothetical protein V8C43DRAFT_192932 [Trichoderma afarasin]
MLLAQINSNSGRTSPCNDSIDAPCAQRAIHHPETQALPSTLSGLAVGKLWPAQVSSLIEQRRAAQPRFPHVRLARFRLTAMSRANLSTSMYCNCMCTRHLWVSCAVPPACSLSRSALREPVRPLLYSKCTQQQRCPAFAAFFSDSGSGPVLRVSPLDDGWQFSCHGDSSLHAPPSLAQGEATNGGRAKDYHQQSASCPARCRYPGWAANCVVS